jgi:hypothetical protein
MFSSVLRIECASQVEKVVGGAHEPDSKPEEVAEGGHNSCPWSGDGVCTHTDPDWVTSRKNENVDSTGAGDGSLDAKVRALHSYHGL